MPLTDPILVDVVRENDDSPSIEHIYTASTDPIGDTEPDVDLRRLAQALSDVLNGPAASPGAFTSPPAGASPTERQAHYNAALRTAFALIDPLTLDDFELNGDETTVYDPVTTGWDMIDGAAVLVYEGTLLDDPPPPRDYLNIRPSSGEGTFENICTIPTGITLETARERLDQKVEAGGVGSLRLTFSSTMHQIRQLQLAGSDLELESAPGPGSAPESMPSAGAGSALRWSVEIDAEELLAILSRESEMQLSVRYRGDLPILQAVTFEGRELLADPGPAFYERPLDASARFFWKLNQANESDAMKRFSFALLFRTAKRAVGVHDNQPYRVEARLSDRYEERTREAGEFVLQELKNTFPAQKGDGLNIGAVATAFNTFASGGFFAGGSGFGEPNGPTMFCFPELAVAMMKMSDADPVWRQLFRVFCVASDVFVKVYHVGHKATYCSMRRPPLGPKLWGTDDLGAVESSWPEVVTEDDFDLFIYSATIDEFDPLTRKTSQASQASKTSKTSKASKASKARKDANQPRNPA